MGDTFGAGWPVRSLTQVRVTTTSYKLRSMLSVPNARVEYKVVDGMIHGFLTMGGKIDAANRAVSMIAERLKTS